MSGYALRSMLLLMCLVVATSCQAKLSTDRFANVFTESESVVVITADNAAVELTNESGKVLTSLQGKGSLDFGKLSPGYYVARYNEHSLPIVVTIDPVKRVKGDSTAAVDNAMSWLVPPQDFQSMSRVLRLAGMTWVRERLTWGEIASEDGSFNFGKYSDAIDSLHSQGIKVYQIFHDSPSWSRKDKDTKAAPDDLRVAFKFARAFAGKYKGKVFAWEFWNEPDISFFNHPSSESAALQKAMFLGAKSVDPTLKILGPSMAMTGKFEERLLQDDAGWYMDIWNYHVYASPEEYQGRADRFYKLLAENGQKMPMWTTEAGDPFATGQDGVLSGDALMHQARFVSRAYPQGIATGVARFFYFVFPFYNEADRGWGMFGPGNKYPYPGLAAMSNATYCLGNGKYLGTVSTSGTLRVMVFDRGNSTSCIAAWQSSEESSQVKLPIFWNQVKEARDYLGRTITIGQGQVDLNLGDAAVYFIVDSKTYMPWFKPAPTKPKVTKSTKPQLFHIVPRLVYSETLGNAGYVKVKDAYPVDPQKPIKVVAQVYNFGNKPFKGRVILTPDSHCTISKTKFECNVAAYGLAEFSLIVQSKGMTDKFSVGMVVRSADKSSSRANIRFALDPDLLPPISGLNIDAGTPKKWKTNIVEGGSTQIQADPDSGVKFVSKFPANVDRWTYPETLPAKINLSGYKALQFEYKTGSGSKGDVRAMLVEDDDVWYVSGTLPTSTKWKLGTVFFDEMWPFQSGDKKLDLDRITRVRIGANSQTDTFEISVRNIRAIKL